MNLCADNPGLPAVEGGLGAQPVNIGHEIDLCDQAPTVDLHGADLAVGE
jgi:hypothetical protein